MLIQGLIFNVFVIGFAGLSTFFDIKEKRIPNKMILFGLAGGVLFNALKGMPQLFDSLLGLLVGVAVLLIPFALGWMGAGDVKFLGAFGAIFGIQWLPRIFFYCALFGGLLGGASIVLRKETNFGFFKRAWADLKLLIITQGRVLPESVGARASKKAGTVPYGVAIGVGALFAFYLDPNGEWAGF
jgi:prepilin peptidase CpaA